MKEKVTKELIKLNIMPEEEIEQNCRESVLKIKNRIEKFLSSEKTSNITEEDKEAIWDNYERLCSYFIKMNYSGFYPRETLENFVHQVVFINEVISELEFKYLSDHKIKGLKSDDAYKRYSVIRNTHAKIQRLQKLYTQEFCYFNDCESEKENLEKYLVVLLDSFRNTAIELEKLQSITKVISQRAESYIQNAKYYKDELRKAKFMAYAYLNKEDMYLYQPDIKNDYRAFKKAYDYYLTNRDKPEFNANELRCILLFGDNADIFSQNKEEIYIISADGTREKIEELKTPYSQTEDEFEDDFWNYW